MPGPAPSIRQVVPRLLVLVAAALAIGWLVGNYRGQKLNDDGIAAINKAGPNASEADYGLAREPFVRAKRFNDDTDLLLREGTTLLFQQAPSERGARLAREATRREPENFTAWALLYQLERQSNPRAAAVARRRALALDPSVRKQLGG